MLETGTNAALSSGRDWNNTALGDAALWPPALRVAVDILLNHPAPMLLTWGERAIPVYNAAYAALAGPLYPPAPGAKNFPLRPAPVAANPEAYQRAAQGQAQQLKAQRLSFMMPGGPHSGDFDLYLTPVHGEDQTVLGVMCSMEPSQAAAAPELPAALRVLVVEDNLDSQFLVMEMLKAFGHEADGVGHGEGALSMLENKTYDVLFSDVSLPGMSGVDLARLALQRQPALQVIFASGYGNALLRHVDFPYRSLQKPYEIDALQAAMEELASLRSRPA
ncbi:MAG: response regulator [Pseudomonadota bacterium]